MRIVEQRGARSCGALFMVEQLLPSGPRVLPAPDVTTPSDPVTPF
jgi:hypothetical protein